MRSQSCAARSPEAGLGRPGRDRRYDKAAAQAPSAAPDRDTRHPARLAPAPDQEQMDLSEYQRTPAGPGGDPSTGPAAGQAEPAVGTPAHPGRTPRPGVPRRRRNDPENPGRSRAYTRATPGIPDLAAVPRLPGRRDPGVRLPAR